MYASKNNDTEKSLNPELLFLLESQSSFLWHKKQVYSIAGKAY